MKMLCTIMAVAALTTFGAAAQDARTDAPKKVGAAEAEKHISETLVVTGKVAQVTIREKLVYLNLDKPFPNSPFTAVIFARATNQFGDLSQLKGKDVELKGKIEEYKDKPQIILNSTNQLKVIEKSDAK
jgi:DNA/RNA endonuclease YhcR with UshA esterase domain